MARLRLSPAVRRAQILDAGEVEMADRGYAGMRIADVARRVDVTRSVVYDHFPSKTALACGVIDRAMDDLLQHVSDAAGSVPDAPGAVRLTAAVEAFYAFVETRPAARRLLFLDPGADDRVVATHARQQHRASDTIADLLRAGLSAEHHHRAPTLAVQVKHALNGLAAWWWEHPERTRDSITEDALILLATGLLPLTST